MKTKRKFLDKIIGQTSLKRELEFYLEGYEKTGYWMPSIFSANRGSGKSLMVKALAAELSEINKKKGMSKGKAFLTINSSEISDSEILFDKVLPLLAQEGDIFLFLDESENLPQKVQCALLSLLTCDDNYNSQYHLSDGTCYEINHKRFTFAGAASSFGGIHPDLIDRLKRFSFQAYTDDDLSKILVKKLPKMTFKDEALAKLVSTLRSSPRHAVARSNDLKMMDTAHFDMAAFKKLRHALSIFPLGLNRDEIALLKVLQRGNATLTELSARLGRTKMSVMDDLEVFLKSKELIKTQGARGRVLTPKGILVLQEIDAIIS